MAVRGEPACPVQLMAANTCMSSSSSSSSSMSGPVLLGFLAKYAGWVLLRKCDLHIPSVGSVLPIYTLPQMGAQFA
jgi:hypothetical protein